MSSSMKKATKMSVADFEAVQSIPDWAVCSFDSYVKYVATGTLRKKTVNRIPDACVAEICHARKLQLSAQAALRLPS